MKTVLITGISRGLGKELFQLFASKDYFVYCVLRNALQAEQLKKVIPKNTKLIIADLATDECIDTIQQAVKDAPMDLLINNAGIGGKALELQEIESTEILDLINIHCLGVFRTVKALEQNLRKAQKPMVLNLNSRLGSITRQSNGTYENLKTTYSYRIAKASQNMLTNCLRQEFKDRIQFISLHPGKMKTEIASSDADIKPADVANRILRHYEYGDLKEENGIVELEKELIEW